MKTTLDIQSELKRRGYYKGALNGKHSPELDYSIRQFQSANGLARDGDVGPKTLAKLFPVKSAPQVRRMVTSAAGRAAITQREGNVLTAYRDSVGILTIGVGHTTAAGAPTVAPGMKITAAQSDKILSRDLATFEKAVLDAVKVPLAQHEFDALVSLAFNIGPTAFAGSTLVEKLNAEDRAGAADAFLPWNKGTVGKKKVFIKGLADRRAAERKQFLNL
ncbi:glycoside hydrolase family protein [Rhizobium sp. PP-CC-3G-465]|uniref:glycoside hydrolase family protein n=1 Tax=Rhizobium sp. PP-CC-3G-465 TaxID=2135648 RepID=UPI001043A53D|nr:GH24 family phage-related lysozyme (muramidase) [Rhizobium sp. PP-CC-3G-465]